MNRPRIRLPVHAGAGQFELGVGPGYYQLSGSDDRLWWDGQDIWLAPGSEDVFAVARGTVRFLPAGRRVELPEPLDEDATTTTDVLPSVGDALVLELWPTVVAALEELLPEDAFLPARIIYQNVDREDAVTRMRELIMADPEAHRAFFQEPGESTIDDAVLGTRVQAWLRDHWLDGDAPGVLVDPTDAAVRIGRVVAPPSAPDELPDDARAETPVPPPAAGWSRLTLKVVTEDGKPANALFWLHLIARVDSSEWTERPLASDDDAFVTACLREVGELRTVHVSHQLDDDWEVGMPPRDDMPPALGSLRLHLRRPGDERRLLALVDPTAPPGHWRLQGAIEESVDYEIEHSGAELYADEDATATTPPAQFLTGQVPDVGVRTRRWLRFGPGPQDRRFILGMNFPQLRRRSGIDLGPNEVMAIVSGHAWYLRPFLRPSTQAEIEGDLANLEAMGIRALRVWVFEHFEGIRFGFTDPAIRDGGQSLLAASMARHDPRGVLGNPVSKTEFDAEVARWRGIHSDGPLARPLDSDPTGHPLALLIQNATWLAERAAAHGMRILWTLFAHYGEKALPQPPPERWFRIAGADRLPLLAWLHRMLIADTTVRASVIRNAVVPFVEAMERCSTPPLGYEIRNELDISWEGCVHSWTHWLDNRADRDRPETTRTHYRLSANVIRSFVEDVSVAIRDAVTRVGARLPEHCVITCSIQGVYNGNDSVQFGRWRGAFRQALDEYRQHLRDELALLPTTGMSCSAISRYFFRTDARTASQMWRESYFFPNPSQPHPTYASNLRQGKLLLTEAGGDRQVVATGLFETRHCEEHRQVVYALLRRSLRLGYAGVFLWQYGDPDRPPGSDEKYGHDFTENPSATHTDAHPPAFPGGRPATATVRNFAREFDRILLPRAGS